MNIKNEGHNIKIFNSSYVQETYATLKEDFGRACRQGRENQFRLAGPHIIVFGGARQGLGLISTKWGRIVQELESNVEKLARLRRQWKFCTQLRA